jgi:hypothetical protein
MGGSGRTVEHVVILVDSTTLRCIGCYHGGRAWDIGYRSCSTWLPYTHLARRPQKTFYMDYVDVGGEQSTIRTAY